ncbi:MAG: hypothetical protein HY066_02680 [Betaproteobacteria bacterium]|nr:hypothetical protein [Betaproteobacteria bacterium]
MALTVRQKMVVDQNHAIHLQSPELKPGSRVEVIVLVESEAQQAKGKPVSFLEEAQNLSIDALPDFSTNFEKNLYGHGN